jgi:large subunit ribosomal protein L21
MYAVIESGGKQYRVEEGDILRLDKLDTEVGKKLSFDRVLMVGEGEAIKLAADAAKANVTAEIVEQGKGKKIVVFKKHRRKNYVRTQGHRQAFTAVRIIKIGEAKAVAAKPAAKAEAKPEGAKSTAAKTAKKTEAKSPSATKE